MGIAPTGPAARTKGARVPPRRGSAGARPAASSARSTAGTPAARRRRNLPPAGRPAGDRMPEPMIPEGAPLPLQKILLAAPRGFCAGVVRAIEIVDLALDCFEGPVYVRREIVHNRHVVRDFEARGVRF